MQLTSAILQEKKKRKNVLPDNRLMITPYRRTGALHPRAINIPRSDWQYILEICVIRTWLGNVCVYSTNELQSSK